MAIDTAAKRASSTLFVVPSFAIGVIPDGTIDQGDRQAVVWMYSGILAEAAVVVEGNSTGWFDEAGDQLMREEEEIILLLM